MPIAKPWCGRPTRTALSPRCSRRPGFAGISMRSMPSTARLPGCAMRRVRYCRAKSACNGGATRWRGKRAARPTPTRSPQRCSIPSAQCALSVEPLLGLIDAHGFDLYDEPMATLADLDAYGRDTEAALMTLGARILAGDAAPGAPALATVPAGIACAVAHRLRSFPLDVSRRQMFVPLELLERHGVSREDVEAHRNTRALQAALAELRAHARAAYGAIPRRRRRDSRPLCAGLPRGRCRTDTARKARPRRQRSVHAGRGAAMASPMGDVARGAPVAAGVIAFTARTGRAYCGGR